MLYLITGVPGSGKTLKMISDLMTRQDLKNRPLYLDGIPEVDEKIIPNLPIPEGETMQTWHKWAPTGAILVIDECQRVFRPRPSGSKVPDFVAELETHRHKGIDIFLLTQHPRLIDSNVRALVGHHCHIGKTNLGVRRMLEWERCADPTSSRDVSSAVKSVYTLDKKAFGVYKSAEEHTKIKTKLSRVVYIFPAVLALLITAGWYIYSSWNNRIDTMKAEQEKPKIEAQASSPEAVGAVAVPTANGTNAEGQYTPQTAVPEPPKPHLSEDDYKPRIEDRPETAPIYDGVNKSITAMPWPSACVKSDNGCNCYTDQGSKISEISKKTCLSYIKDGLPFNPYKAKKTETAEVKETEQEIERPQVLSMGGKSQQNLMYDGYVEKGNEIGAQNGAKTGS